MNWNEGIRKISAANKKEREGQAMTPPRDQQSALLPCPFCGKIPSVTTHCWGHAMGRIRERGDGSKYDPSAATCYSTEFRCTKDCPCDSLRIQLDSPNPQAFEDGIDRSKTEAQIHAEAVAKWNTRALTAHDEAREHLGNLLAIIHGDGGHYQAEHGNEKATTDAIAKYYELRAKHDEALPGEWETVDRDGVYGNVIDKTTGKRIFTYVDLRDCDRATAAHNSALRALKEAGNG